MSAPWSWSGGAPASIPTGCCPGRWRRRALRTEALAALIGDPEPGRRGVMPAQLGAAVRWITRQPAAFTGHVLTFQRLRELGALPVHDTGGVR